MLKWTGGSRRKVSTSRKSTQSKQKQYFEQKRRLQKTPSIDNPSETNKWGHSSVARSLDILSFRNLATIAQNKEPVHIEGTSSTQAFYDPFKQSSPAVLKKFISLHPTKLNEAYDHNSSCVSKEENSDLSKLSPAMAVKKITSELSNKPNESGSIPRISSFHEPFGGLALNYTEKLGEKIPSSIPFKSVSSGMKQKGKSNLQSEVSVLDLLDDGDSERNVRCKSGPETYVAFSIKGLGKVEVNTPPQSPLPDQRGFPEPPRKVARRTRRKEFQSIPFETEMVLDSVLHDTNLINDFGPPERMGDYGPFVGNGAFDKEIHLKDIFSPDSFDAFEDSPDCGQDGGFGKYIYEQIWNGSFGETANGNVPGNRYDELWDTNLFDLEDIYGSCPNEDMFDPTHTGFEEYNDSPTLRTQTKGKRRWDLNSARPGPSCSTLMMENECLPTDSDWKRDLPTLKRKSDYGDLFSQPVWPVKDGVAEMPDITSLRSEESCSSTRVKEVKNYSFQSYVQEHKNNHVDDFPIELNFTSPKFNNVSSQACGKGTGTTKSNTAGSKPQKISRPQDDIFLDCNLFPDCNMYMKSKEPSKSVTREQRSGTYSDFHANGEEKFDFFGDPESELPNGIKSSELPNGIKSSCLGEVGLGMKERCSENEGPKCESEKFSDEAECAGHTEADKCSLEESPLVHEACANGTPNTPYSQQSERCNLAEDNCDKILPFTSQAENQGDEKGKCDAQYQVMLQSYVFQLLCVQKVLLEASGKEKNK